MRKFTIPFSYTVNGEIEIEGNSLSNAISNFNRLAEATANVGYHAPILDNATTLTPLLKTIEVDEDKAEEINPPIKWLVHITRTQTVVVEVEAHDDGEAEELATRRVDQGDEEDNFEEGEVEVTEVVESEN
jgi:hypothetical protein